MGNDTQSLSEHLLKLLNAPAPPDLPEELLDDPAMLQLHNQLLIIRETIASFSRGDVSIDITTRGFIAGGLKALQANLRHLVWQVKQVEMDDYSQRVSFLGEFSTAFNNMVERLDTTLQELRRKEAALIKLNQSLQTEIELRTAAMQALKKNEAKLKHLAGHDALTGILNRRLFMDKARRMLRTSMRHNKPCGVIMLDVDRFKLFNDTYGHQAGDAALRHVADTVSVGLRERDMVARYGGEEFVFCFNGTGLEEARGLAERIRRSLEDAPLFWEDIPLRITASLGVCIAMPEIELPLSMDLLEYLISEADKNLYAAKNSGRNCVVASVAQPTEIQEVSETYDSSTAANFASNRRKQSAPKIA